MKQYVKIFIFSVVAALGVTSGVVQAQTGYYLGVSAGMTNADTGITAITAKLDDSSTGFKLYGGLQVTPQLSVELAYVNLGEATLSGNAGDQFIVDGTLFQFLVNNAQIKFEPTLVSIGGRFSIPMSQAAEFYARLGFSSWNVDITANASGTAGGGTSESGTDPYYGVGIGYEFTPSVVLSIDFEHYELDTQSANYFSLGVAKRF